MDLVGCSGIILGSKPLRAGIDPFEVGNGYLSPFGVIVVL